MADLPSAEQIFAGLPDTVLLIDADHIITRVNPAAEQFLGTSAKHLIGQPVQERIQFDDDRLTNALTDNAADIAARGMNVSVNGSKAGLVDLNIQMLPADPRWRLVSISLHPADGPADKRASGKSGDFSVRAPDILGHEIKNPLAAIKGAAQLLERSAGEGEKPLTELIQTEVERIASLIDRMQSLSTTQPAKAEAMNVHALIDEARQSLETASDGALSIGDKFDPSLPDVLVDPDAMMQVLTNLLSNAVDAVRTTESPQIEVATRYSFGASFSAQGADQAVRLPVEIVISDNGPGVPAELEGDIFSPFVSTKPDGQGLGLALVRKLVADMGGRIRYEREEQTGRSRFILFLPIAQGG